MPHATYQASIDTAIEQITPLYDWLLVRRLHEEEYAGLVISSDMVMTPGGKWVKKSDSGPRRGEVVRMGRGDKRMVDDPGWSTDPEHPPYDAGMVEERIPMAVREGDVIIYPRFESTHVVVQGEQLTFVREGDVMAVLDGE